MLAAPNSAVSRLRKEAVRIKMEAVPFVTAAPSPNNILEWHYVVEGPPESAYAGGFYHGMLVFPADYPFKPPSIYMITPNGRFRTNSRLCLSISDFHPDTWNPTWSVSTILTGLLSFMLENSPTLGSLSSSDEEKRVLAGRSIMFNLKSEKFRTLFPELTEKMKAILASRQATDSEEACNSRNTMGAVSSLMRISVLHSIGSHFAILFAFIAFVFVARFIVVLHAE